MLEEQHAQCLGENKAAVVAASDKLDLLLVAERALDGMRAQASFAAHILLPLTPCLPPATAQSLLCCMHKLWSDSYMLVLRRRDSCARVSGLCCGAWHGRDSAWRGGGSCGLD